jgi:ankyrin repeat protein
MRLLKLNEDGTFSLVNPKDKIPPYAILSHTWGRDDEEVNYKDIVEGTGNTKQGFQKLKFCGNQAKADNLHYFWVDTCCIDKSSSTELSEAINSMFKWYQNAERCYVYLSDFTIYTQDGRFRHIEWESAFRNSQWFKRGWTLQELLAPKIVQFFSKDNIRFGDKKSLEQHIHNVTGIDIEALQGERDLGEFDVDERLKWVDGRQTTLAEDKAYCLLGIFDIFLTPIYGEGYTNAKNRLLKEIKEPDQNVRQSFNSTTINGHRDENRYSSSDTLPKWEHETNTLPLPEIKPKLDTQHLIESARKGNLSELQEILRRNSPVDEEILNRALVEASTNDNGSTNQPSVISLLIDNGAKLESQGKKSKRMALIRRLLGDEEAPRTPLILAIINGKRDVVEAMLRYNPNLEQGDDDFGWTPLIWAACHDHQDIVRLLISNSCQLDSTDVKLKRTALHWATYCGNSKVIKILLQNMRNKDLIEAKDADGMTALMLAVIHKHYLVAELLLKNDANPNCVREDGLCLLVWTVCESREYVRYVKLLVEKGADVDSKDNNGTPVLCLAARARYGDVIEILLDNGNPNIKAADIEAADAEGHTALWWAIKAHNSNVAKYLREKGAKLENQE